MTFTIVYNRATYHLTLDETGEPAELLVEQPDGGTPLNAPFTALPSWLHAKVRTWWEVQTNND